jgi:predicted DNA-binding transcriptional regulator AlpA
MNSTALATVIESAPRGADPFVPVRTPKQAADYLTISLSTLARMRIAGNGPRFVRLSPQKVGYRPSDLEEFLQSRTRTSTSQL